MRGFGKKTLLIFVILITGLAVFAVDTWQGSAAMIRRGEFDSPGMYAASNSFTPNSKIQVVNQRTGQSVEVTIIKRMEYATNVLLLLSEEAASVIGVGVNDVVNVDISLISYGYDEIVGLPDDLPFNPDPDVYPVFEDEPTLTPYSTFVPTPEITPEPTPAITSEPTTEPTAEPTPEPTPEFTPVIVEESPEPTEVVTPEPTPEQTSEPTIEPTLEPSAEPTVEPVSEPTPISLVPDEVLVQRIPQKNFFLPPREDETYFLSDLFVENVETPEDFPLDFEDPSVESPLVSSIDTPVKEEKNLDFAFLNVPSLETRESGKPEVLLDYTQTEEEKHYFDTSEPPLPEDESNQLEEVAGIFMRAEEAKVSVMPSEPDLPQDKAFSKPEVYADFPVYNAEDYSFTVFDPAIPEKSFDKPVITEEIPHTDESYIAFNTSEPPVPEKNSDNLMDITHDVPESGYEGEVELVLEPTEPRPPHGDSGETKIVFVDEKDDHKSDQPPVSFSDELERGNYYVQLGAYTDPKRAQSLENQYKSLYPVKIISNNSMKLEIYKVLLGPLNKDESDTLLYRFKALGYRDAFVKYVN